MDKRQWNVLCWNIRGINATDKGDVVRQKIEESVCSVVCLQETKWTTFDSAYVRNFAPCHFDKFEFFPSVGLSSGLLVLWNSSIFSGDVVETKPYAIMIDFIANHDQSKWCLSSIYGPCHQPLRSEFVNWMRALNTNVIDHWLFVGDFNFYRSLEDRNRPPWFLMTSLVILALRKSP